VRRVITQLAIVAIVSAGCGGGDSPAATNLRTEFDVTPQDDVVVLDERLVADHLVAHDAAAGEYRFAQSLDEVDGLVVGEPVVIDGAGFGLVESVTAEGSETVLHVGPATLGDVIKDGTMEWDYDISWTDFDVTYEETAALSSAIVAQLPGAQLVAAAGPGASAAASLAIASVEAQTSRKTSVEFTYQGWKFSLELEPKGDKLNYGLVGSFGIGDSAAQASIRATGWVSGFSYSSVLEYRDGAPAEVSTEINGLKGEMELQWAAFRTPQQALADIVKFNAPLSLPIPLLGPLGVPLTLQLKLAGRIVPELSALESSSGGKWKVTYSSDQGFNVEGNGTGLPVGALNSKSIDTSGDTVTAGQGPAGFGLGVEFPRFELAFAGLAPFAFITVDMYSTSLWTPGTLLTGDIPPCQYGSTKLSAIAGYELSVLGMAKVADQYTLWEEQVDKYLDGKRCTLSGE